MSDMPQIFFASTLTALAVTVLALVYLAGERSVLRDCEASGAHRALFIRDHLALDITCKVVPR